MSAKDKVRPQNPVRKRPRRSPGGRRPWLTIILLPLTLAATAALAFQAYDAAKAQHNTAERVLNDYAAMAANEIASRLRQNLGFYGAYRGLNPLADPEELPDPSQISASRPFTEPLVRSFFRLRLTGSSRGNPAPGNSAYDRQTTGDPGTEFLEIKGADPASRFREEFLPVLRQAYAAYQDDWYWHLAFVVEERAAPLLLVYRRRPSKGPGTVLEGGVVAPDALSERLRMSRRSPIMPAPLDEALDESHLDITVRLPSGVNLMGGYEPPSNYSYDPTAPVVRRHVELDPQLAGLQVFVGLDREAAEQLIIGGLPGSRTPLLIGLVVLAGTLFLATVLQIRREREFARRQSDFIAAVSHELRTPLAQIQMFSDTLRLERVRSGEERRRSLDIITQESQRLSNLVENIIQFSRSQRHKVRLQPTSLDLAELVEEVAERFAPLAASSQNRLRTRIQGSARVHADPDALRRVLLNLLDNAVKYGPRGQTVTLGLSVLPETARLWVEDEGEGIAENEREEIFRRFQRLDRHRNAAVAGTGIGLAVVRELVEAHQGRVWCEDARTGGARLVVELLLDDNGHAQLNGPSAGSSPTTTADGNPSAGERQ